MTGAGLAFYPGKHVLVCGGETLTLSAAETAILTLMTARPGHWFLWSEIARVGQQYGWPAERCAGVVEKMRRLAVVLLGTPARIEADPKDEMFRLVGEIPVG